MNRGFFFMKFTNMRKLVLFVITTVLATFFLISLMVISIVLHISAYLALY
ncbi:stage II sporulation protein P, partial [Bacillus sp. D-CC]